MFTYHCRRLFIFQVWIAANQKNPCKQQCANKNNKKEDRHKYSHIFWHPGYFQASVLSETDVHFLLFFFTAVLSQWDFPHGKFGLPSLPSGCTGNRTCVSGMTVQCNWFTHWNESHYNTSNTQQDNSLHKSCLILTNYETWKHNQHLLHKEHSKTHSLNFFF